jgi:predicted transcriptional regulator
MLRPIRSTFKRRPRKRVVSRSFRIPPDIDRDLDAIAREKQWTKSFLIRDIIVSYISFHRAKARVE